VQSLQHDGAVMLHTRSSKYGRLSGGQAVQVPADLAKRQKLHFQHLEAAGVDIILGCNGLVWVAPHSDAPAGEGSEGGEQRPQPGREQREAVARVAQAAAALARLGCLVHGASIAAVAALAAEQGVAVRDMQAAPFLARIARMGEM
jgi:exosome complex component RRP4